MHDMPSSSMIQSYIINLEQDAARMSVIATRFQELGLAFERIDAVDGRQMPDVEFDNFARARPLKNGGWGRGQAGCFLSHYQAWEKIAGGADSYAAIFEDDLHIADAIATLFRTDAWLPEIFDIVRLETSTNRLLLDTKATRSIAGRAVFRLRSPSWCAGAYILNRDGARKLLSVPPARHNSVDHFLFSFEGTSVARELEIYQMVPALAIQDKFTNKQNGTLGFRSNIEKHSFFDRLVLSLRRITPLVLYKTVKGFKRVPFQP